jgi:arylsulfatase
MVRFGDWLYTWNAWPERHNLSGESAWTGKFAAVAELWTAAEQGQLTPAQALLTKAPQPAEMLFRVSDDPHQFNNLAGNKDHAAALKQAQSLMARWKAETGDSVPAKPTADRSTLHESTKGEVVRGDFPGAAHGAAKINHPGPLKLGESALP